MEAERPATGEIRHTSSAYLTLAAVDEEGRATPVPALRTSGPEDTRRQREAQTRRDNRLAERAELQRTRVTGPTTRRA